VRIGVLSRV